MTHQRIDPPHFVQALTRIAKAMNGLPALNEHQSELASALRAAPDKDAAILALARVALEQPQNFGASLMLVSVAGASVNEPSVDASLQRMTIPAHKPAIDFVVVSHRDQRFAVLHEQISRLWQAWPHRVIRVADGKSMAEAANRGIAQTTAPYVVLCHDDIHFLRDDFAARLSHHLLQFDLLGPVGATQVNGPATLWAGHPYIHGWVSHLDAQSITVDVYRMACSSATGAMALDGMFMAGKREVFTSVRFDDVLYDGWHCYDIDFCLRAYRTAARIAVCPDLWLHHASQGQYGADWEHYAARFCEREFPGQTGMEPGDAHRSRVRTASLQDAARTMAILENWVSRATQTL